VVDEGMSLEDYVRSGISVELNDWHTRVLAGPPDPPFGATDRSLLDRALANIENHFSVVGLSERFDETVVMLKRSLRWKRPYYAPLNATRGRPAKAELPDAALRAIQEFNALDIELYERSRASFEEAIRADPTFGRELRSLHRRNSAYGPLAPLDRTARRGVNLWRRLPLRRRAARKAPGSAG
jgi:tetratricopeptide (TPR) repeat protein